VESGPLRSGRAVRLHSVLLAALLAGVVLGCLLAGLSVLDPGLLPAIG
jgi:tetrahydromethanopterin S-methyltransferase subunit F